MLTSWSTVLETLIVTELVKKLSAYYGTRRFITVFTLVRILSQMNPVHTLPLSFNIHSTIVPSTPRSSDWSLSYKIFNKNSVYISHLPIRATCPAHLIRLDLITLIIFVECISYEVFYNAVSSSLPPLPPS